MPSSIYYGPTMENGIDWANFAGVPLAAFVLVLLVTLALSRRDIYA